jgi:hypothetical protein
MKKGPNTLFVAVKNRWKVLASIALLSAFLGSYNLAFGEQIRNASSVSERFNLTEEYTDALIANQDNRLEIYFQIQAIDTIREAILVGYEIVPYGTYGYSWYESGYLEQGIELWVNSGSYNRELNEGTSAKVMLNSGDLVGGFEVPVNLYPCTNIDGSGPDRNQAGYPDSASYPNDAYCFNLVMNAWWLDVDGTTNTQDRTEYPAAAFRHFGSGIDGYLIEMERIPTGIVAASICQDDSLECTPVLSTTAEGYSAEWNVNGEPGRCYPGWECTIASDFMNGSGEIRGIITRTPVVIAFASIVIFTVVLAALCAVVMTVAVVSGARPPALEGLAFLAALLFAVQPLRGALPDAPPIGMNADVLLFYPSVLLILLCLVAQVAIWVRRSDYRV